MKKHYLNLGLQIITENASYRCKCYSSLKAVCKVYMTTCDWTKGLSSKETFFTLASNIVTYTPSLIGVST